MLLLLAACHPFGDDGHVTIEQPDMAEPDPSVPNPAITCSQIADPPLGSHGLLAFYLGWPDGRVTNAFAAGSHDQIVTQAVGRDQRIASIAPSDPSVLSLELQQPFQSCGFAIIDLEALAPGHASIVAFDKNGQAIDTFPVDVANTSRLALDPEAVDAAIYVGASGHVMQAHVITDDHDGKALHGLGAIKFAGSGSLYDVTAETSAIDTGDPLSDAFAGGGDFVQLRVAPGDGTLTMSAPGTVRALAIHGTLGDEVDALTIDKTALVASTEHPGQWSTRIGVHASAGGHAVSAMKCGLLDVDTTGFLTDVEPLTVGKDAIIDLTVLAKTGDYTISCTIGSQVATLPLHVP